MESLGYAGIAALIIAVLGFILGSKSKEEAERPSPTGMDEAKEVLHEHIEEVNEAGDAYSSAMGRSTAGRVRDILRRYRERTNK